MNPKCVLKNISSLMIEQRLLETKLYEAASEVSIICSIFPRPINVVLWYILFWHIFDIPFPRGNIQCHYITTLRSVGLHILIVTCHSYIIHTYIYYTYNIELSIVIVTFTYILSIEKMPDFQLVHFLIKHKAVTNLISLIFSHEQHRVCIQH